MYARNPNPPSPPSDSWVECVPNDVPCPESMAFYTGLVVYHADVQGSYETELQRVSWFHRNWSSLLLIIMGAYHIR